MLLPVVAMDDALGLMLYAIMMAIARTLDSGAALSVMTLLVKPLIEIVGSLAMGVLIGTVMVFCLRFFHSRGNKLTMTILIVFLAVGLSTMLDLSSLLVCMMLGTVFCNVCDFSAEIMDKTDRWTAPLYILFFVLSGAELELNVFSNMSVVIIGAAYILARSFGKWFGASMSAKFMKCPPKVQKWLGITLLPQAGVALGMSVTVAQTLGADGAMVRNIVLFGVLIYELVGPALTRIALTEAGDIQPKAEAVVSADD